MRTSHTCQIARPTREVWAFLADVRNEPRWRESITGSSYVGADAPAAGVDGVTEVRMGQRELTMRWTVVELEPGERVAWRLDGDPWHGGGSYEVRDDGATCTVRASLEVRLHGAARLLEPVLGLQVRAGLRSDLRRLVELLSA